MFGCAVRIVTGHVVSSSSMVSRAFLTDAWRAVIVDGESDGLWLVATLDALAPDRAKLLTRSEQEGGPPAQYGRVALVRLTVSWGETDGDGAGRHEVHIANPVVVKHPDGGPIAVVPLSATSALARAVHSATGPRPISMEDLTTVPEPRPRFDDEVDVQTMFRGGDGSYWLLSRRSRTASDRDGGFLGEANAVAIDLALDRCEAGSPAFSVDGANVFRGLVRPLSDTISMLVSPCLITETIAHACTTNR